MPVVTTPTRRWTQPLHPPSHHRRATASPKGGNHEAGGTTVTKRSLETAAAEVIDVLHQHRLLTTSQLRELVLPERSLRPIQQVLAELARRRLLDSVASRPGWPGPGERVWFLNRRGVAVAEELPDRAEPRSRPMTTDKASSLLQAHTLAVNAVGVAFTRAARERGDEFDSRSWRHEIAHDIVAGRRRRLLIADALLRYWTGDGSSLHYRFLEVDRGNALIDDLLAKLKRYVALHDAWRNSRNVGEWERERLPVWPYRYLAFPSVLVIFADGGRADPVRRLTTAMAGCQDEPEFKWKANLFRFALFDDLIAFGPFAAVFRRLDSDRPVNWLHRLTDDSSPRGADTAPSGPGEGQAA